MANRSTIGRVQNKMDSSEDWARATTFIPLSGEIIVYSDLGKIKIGDGETTVTDLPFVKGKPDVKIETVLLASGWQSDQYSFESQYPHANYDVSVELSSQATETQYKLYGKAGLVGNATYNTLRAIKGAPTIDIPIILTIKEK